jgi:hypothetical protein
MSADELEHAYRRAYRDFYQWGSILRGASVHGTLAAGLRHVAYSAGWKKFEPLWDLVIRAKRVGMMLPLLETILMEFGKRAPGAAGRIEPVAAIPRRRELETVETTSKPFRPAILRLASRCGVRQWSTDSTPGAAIPAQPRRGIR